MLIAKTEIQAEHFKIALESEGYEPVIVIDQTIWAVCRDIIEAYQFIALSVPKRKRLPPISDNK
jgi:hypothetical protein